MQQANRNPFWCWKTCASSIKCKGRNAQRSFSFAKGLSSQLRQDSNWIISDLIRCLPCLLAGTLTLRMSIHSNELNFLIYRYLQESGTLLLLLEHLTIFQSFHMIKFTRLAFSMAAVSQALFTPPSRSGLSAKFKTSM